MGEPCDDLPTGLLVWCVREELENDRGEMRPQFSRPMRQWDAINARYQREKEGAPHPVEAARYRAERDQAERDAAARQEAAR